MAMKGNGAVLPAGTIPAVDQLPKKYEVLIDGFDESGLIRCIYPNKFVKHHQADTVEALATQIVAQLRGRYGVQEVNFTSAPKTITEGETFKVGA